jgi:hypothetical protein
MLSFEVWVEASIRCNSYILYACTISIVWMMPKSVASFSNGQAPWIVAAEALRAKWLSAGKYSRPLYVSRMPCSSQSRVFPAGFQWLPPRILATWEAEIGRIAI